MMKHQIWQQAAMALVQEVEPSTMQRHRTLEGVPAEGVVMLNIGCLLLLLIGQSLGL